MERLKALPFVDTVAVSAKLDNLISSVDNLPLLSDPVITEVSPPMPAGGSQPRFWSGFGRELGMHAMAGYSEVKNVFMSTDA